MPPLLTPTPRQERTPPELLRAYRAGWCSWGQQRSCPWMVGDPARDVWERGRQDAAMRHEQQRARLRRLLPPDEAAIEQGRANRLAGQHKQE